jgi:cyclic peptide transporter
MLPNIIQVFKKRSKFFYLFVIILAVSSSALNVAILAFISNIVSNDRLPIFYFNGWIYFLGLITFSLFISKTFQTYLVKLTNNLLYDIEILLLQKLRSSTFQSFEKLGSQRVFTAMGDIRVIGRIPNHFISAFNAVIVLICCLGYLFIISPFGMIAMVLMMSGLLTFYMIRNKHIEKSLNVLRSLMNNYFKYLNDLLLGFKEIKMSSNRNNILYDKYLKKNRETGNKLTIDTSIKYLNNDLVGSYSWYLVIGVILFILPRFLLLDVGHIVAMLFVILYMMGPVAILISMIQVYTNVKIAIERLNEFEKDVDSKLQSERTGKPVMALDMPFESLEFENVTFQFNDRKKQQTFLFGPVSLKITKGEIVFITGGNGSGKSTFVNLITGLYKPLSGNIYVNEHKIGEETYIAYTNLISSIFTNHYLFTENYDEFELINSNSKLMEYASWLKMENVIRIDEEHNRISTELSKGQQKRLLMIYALMEEREILVLDEWAAEQEPEFRAYFYNSLLPKLKSIGKTIIVVTHDDSYFSFADRIVKFDFGKIIADEVLTSQIENN